jgi:hypothetical protein
MHVESISKFGRNFSIVSIPYSFKLLIQELSAINVQMRIITEDNIEQFENMSFKTPLDSKEYIRMMNQRIRESDDGIPTADMLEIPTAPTESQVIEPATFLPKTPEGSPPYPPGSVQYPANSSPPYPLGSIQYPVDSSTPYLPGSIQYPADSSPPYPPGSIQYPVDSAEAEKPEQGRYKIGDQVHLRGDSPPTRVWKIKDIGNKYITIETDGNDIKVVTEPEIYPAVVITGGDNYPRIPAGFFSGGGGGGGMDVGDTNRIPYSFGGGGIGGGIPGGITIMPIFNNGGGGGGGFAEPSPPTPYTPPPVSASFGGNNTTPPKTTKTTTVTAKTEGGSVENEVLGGLKSIGGFIVKKLGGIS